MGTMMVMDRTGHTSVEWDPASRDSLKVARDTFERMTGQGYRAFRIQPGGGQGTRIETFDPAAEKMMLIPHLAGG